MKTVYCAMVLLVLLSGATRAEEISEEQTQLFLRATVLQAEGATGSLEVNVEIHQLHRTPWYTNSKVTTDKLQPGAVSKWMDLSKGLTKADGDDEVTARVWVKSAGKRLNKRIRIRFELARSDTATTALASTVVEDGGGRGGIIIPERGVKDADLPKRFKSVAEVAQEHLKATEGFGLSRDEMPKKFIASTRCNLLDYYSDMDTARKELEAVMRMGYNTIDHIDLRVAKELGVPYFQKSGGYRPDGKTAKYTKMAKEVKSVFGSTDRLRLVPISDEPGWFVPSVWSDDGDPPDPDPNDPDMLGRFREYLRNYGITPRDFGKTSWDQMRLWGLPEHKLPPEKNSPLIDRRQWYHTIRFVGQEKTRKYTVETEALKRNFGEDILAYTNWNNVGIYYVGNPWGGPEFYPSHDWFEFSRLKGGTCLWNGPGVSEGGGSTFRMVSLMMNLLRSAASEGAGHFGAYIHHNFVDNDRGHEIALSIMSLAGYGGSGYNSYAWGPRYTWTEYMWSEKLGHYEHVADTNRLIGKAEDMMVGADPPKAQVAIIWPTTSQMYDLNASGFWTWNRDYLVEAEHVWFALNHYGIPVDFVDETIVQRGDLKKYKMLYVTDINLRLKTAESIRNWVRDGGYLWTSAGAGRKDEYDDPMTALDEVLGVTSRQVKKINVNYDPRGDLRKLKSLGRIEMGPSAGLGTGPWNAYGSRADFKVTDGKVLGQFSDGKPAVIRNEYGKGVSLHFAAMPGLAYSRGATEKRGTPTIDYPPRIAKLITALPDELGVKRPARTNRLYVEAVMLQSQMGKAVTLLNWSGKPVENLEVTIEDTSKVKSVTSARLGTLEYTRNGDAITVNLPMPRVTDVIMLK